MQLRPSELLKYLDCPRSYKYQYVDRLEPLAQSANLSFGTAVHAGVTGYAEAIAKGNLSFDPVKTFEESFRKEYETREIIYTVHDQKALIAIGRVLTERWPDYWEGTGLIVATDTKGEPIVERRIYIDLGQGLIVSMQPDIVAMNISGQTYGLDVKTPASSAPPGFAIVSDQLAAYRLGLSVHAQALGIPPPSWLGFMDGIKKAIPKTARGEGPHWEKPDLVPCNANVAQQEIVQKFHEVASDIRNKRFKRNPRMAWNTPCEMCDFRRLCYEGSMEGLRERQSEPDQIAA